MSNLIFPRVIYHPEHPPTTIKSHDEKQAMGHGWSYNPADAEPQVQPQREQLQDTVSNLVASLGDLHDRIAMVEQTVADLLQQKPAKPPKPAKAA